MGLYFFPTYHFVTEAKLLEYIFSLWVYVDCYYNIRQCFLNFHWMSVQIKINSACEEKVNDI